MGLPDLYPAQVGSPYTTLAAPYTSGEGTMTLVDATKLPTAPNIVCLAGDVAGEFSYTGKEGNVLQGVTALPGTPAATTWSAGTFAFRGVSAYDHNALIEYAQMDRPKRGAYDAIVYISDTSVIAEDATGATIATGTAGTDDATVIQAAIDNTIYGEIRVVGNMTLTDTVTLNTKIALVGNGTMRTVGETDYPVWTIDTTIGLSLGTTSTSLVGTRIENISFKSATSGSNTAIWSRRGHNYTLRNLMFTDFDKALDIGGLYTSHFSYIYTYNCNYGLYVSAHPTRRVADLIFNVCDLSNCNTYSIYAEDDAVSSMRILGGIMENTGSFTGGCIRGGNDGSYRIYNCYLSANSKDAYITDFSTSIKCLLHGCSLYRGMVTTGHSGIISNCHASGETRLYIDGQYSQIQGCDISFYGGTTGDAVITVTEGSSFTIVSGNIFHTCAAQYHVNVLAPGCNISNNRFGTINSSNNIADSYAIHVGPGVTTAQIVNNTHYAPNAVGMINDEGSTTLVANNTGYITSKHGTASSVADGGTIAHRCGATPTYVALTGSVAGEMVTVTSIDATNITVAIKKSDGSAGTSQTIYWRAEV